MCENSYKSMDILKIVLVLSLVLSVLCSEDDTSTIRKLSGVRFLITVNDTWAEPPGCMETVVTDMIHPGKKSGNIMVGACDNGPIEYTILSPGKDNCKYTVSLTFHSSVIEDASPPTCDLSWNGTYLVPKPNYEPEQDLLPNCFTADSREGYHMTYYWFHILEWFYE